MRLTPLQLGSRARMPLVGAAAQPAVVRVTIDPDLRFPDVDRESNRWPRQSR